MPRFHLAHLSVICGARITNVCWRLFADMYHENDQYTEAHKNKTGNVRINVRFWRVRATIVVVEHYEIVFVTLVIQQAMRNAILSSVAGSTAKYFSTSHKRHD